MKSKFIGTIHYCPLTEEPRQYYGTIYRYKKEVIRLYGNRVSPRKFFINHIDDITGVLLGYYGNTRGCAVDAPYIGKMHFDELVDRYINLKPCTASKGTRLSGYLSDGSIEKYEKMFT